MKPCPICGALAFDDALMCYGCLHPFEPDDDIRREGDSTPSGMPLIEAEKHMSSVDDAGGSNDSRTTAQSAFSDCGAKEQEELASHSVGKLGREAGHDVGARDGTAEHGVGNRDGIAGRDAGEQGGNVEHNADIHDGVARHDAGDLPIRISESGAKALFLLSLSPVTDPTGCLEWTCSVKPLPDAPA